MKGTPKTGKLENGKQYLPKATGRIGRHCWRTIIGAMASHLQNGPDGQVSCCWRSDLIDFSGYGSQALRFAPARAWTGGHTGGARRASGRCRETGRGPAEGGTAPAPRRHGRGDRQPARRHRRRAGRCRPDRRAIGQGRRDARLRCRRRLRQRCLARRTGRRGRGCRRGAGAARRAGDRLPGGAAARRDGRRACGSGASSRSASDRASSPRS